MRMIQVWQLEGIAFVFSIIEPRVFEGNVLLNKIYRDDKILVTKVKQNIMRFKTQIESFQKEVNKLLESNKLQFILDIQVYNENDNTNININKQITINQINIFLFKDMKMAWNESRIAYKVYFKENQRIKYLN